ncbi:protein of unknown function [Burkholderia multivorans]
MSTRLTRRVADLKRKRAILLRDSGAVDPMFVKGAEFSSDGTLLAGARGNANANANANAYERFNCMARGHPPTGERSAPALHFAAPREFCDRMNGRCARTRNCGSGARAFLPRYEKV